MNIDELTEGTKWASRPHADYTYSHGGKAVVVEDTGRPELRDIEKVRESIEMVRTSSLYNEVVAGIVHYRRGDTMFNKIIAREARRRPPILPANCYDKLCSLLRKPPKCTMLRDATIYKARISIETGRQSRAIDHSIPYGLVG